MARQYFGTDGIRDVAGQGQLAPEWVDAYGRAVGAYLATSGRTRLLMGRDTRESGPTLVQQISRGLLAAGHDVVDGGVLPTPAVQALCAAEAFGLAIVVSASHNPPADNGLKFFGPDGRKLPDDAEESIERLITSARDGSLPTPTVNPGTSWEDPAAARRYEDSVLARFPSLPLRGRTVVVDAGFGAAFETAPNVLRRLGARLVLRGVEPDGKNINVGAGVFHVDALGEVVRQHDAVLGLALDGDADRVLLVDETGQVRDGDFILGVLARDLLARDALPESRVVTTVMANLGLKAFLARGGMVCDMTPVGDRFVAARMAEAGAALGGEQSGHVLFREGDRWYGDGLYTALRVLQVIADSGTPLSRLCDGLEKFPQVLVNVAVAQRTPVDEVPELVEARDRAEADLGDDGRVLLRYSGTEPLLRVMVEGRDLARIRGHVDVMVDVAQRHLGRR